MAHTCRKCTHVTANLHHSVSNRFGTRRRKHKLNSASFWQLLPFASKRFHVLLNSLFKVLCNFPSRYLFAIGLVVIFSLTWGLPRIRTALSSNPTLRRLKLTKIRSYMGLAPSLGSGPAQGDSRKQSMPDRLSFTSQFVAAKCRTIRRWAFPRSVALTKGIMVIFFSTA